MAGAFLWCKHCGQPHSLGLSRCPTTSKVLDTRMNEPPKPQALAVSELIEQRYRIKKFVGEGATSHVYLADDTALERVVAIKVHKSTRGRRLRRFEQEARLLHAVDHPNVVRLFGSGRVSDGRPYIVMEAVRGQTLLQLLDRVKTIGETFCIGIARQLLAGLHAAHRAGIVHRDVKPGNIFLVKNTDSVSTVKLLDFGMALPPERTALVVTRPGVIYGTPGYVAPEVLFGARPNARCDIWAVGVVMFEMLAGVSPFNPSEGFAATRALPPPLRAQAPNVGRHLASIVDRAMAADPRSRFESAAAFGAALVALAFDVKEAAPSSSLQFDALFPAESATGTLPVLERTPPSGTAVPRALRTEDTLPDSPARSRANEPKSR